MKKNSSSRGSPDNGARDIKVRQYMKELRYLSKAAFIN